MAAQQSMATAIENILNQPSGFSDQLRFCDLVECYQPSNGIRFFVTRLPSRKSDATDLRVCENSMPEVVSFHLDASILKSVCECYFGFLLTDSGERLQPVDVTDRPDPRDCGFEI